MLVEIERVAQCTRIGSQLVPLDGRLRLTSLK